MKMLDHMSLLVPQTLRGWAPDGVAGGMSNVEQRGHWTSGDSRAEKRGAGQSAETSGFLEAGCPIPAVTVAVHPFVMFVLSCLSLPTTPAPL